ncbi:TatD family hydrolase [Microbacterium resistens]|uniref:TatD family hydrolase n=1 Tax=Microbacterium resistens TaxID=156977 RepID=A0ABY3RWF0_9MICO|nr:TatD family hydrolase [Microbacterium resistens]UGS26767.1 TatD family hydrolase [Microbacterium resistens]
MTHPDTYVRERSADGRKDLRYPPAPEPLAVPVYDNHCHLEIEDGDDPLTLAEQLDRAEAVGIAGVVQASGDIASSRWAVAAAEADRRVLAAVAIHPNDAPTYAAHGRLDEALAVIDELAGHPRTRAIGETGLDYFRTGEDGRAAQHTSFEAHIALAKKHRLAMQIHDRDAHDEVLATLSRVGAPERTVFHCFSGDDAMARTCADAGYYLSFAGTVTFKNAQNLRDALRVTPLDRILVETDAPFLAPVPLRGRPNAPYLIPITLRFMAAELGLDPDALAAQVAENTRAVYGAFD